MTKKRILALLLAAVMTVALAACGGQAEPAAPDAGSGTAQPAPPAPANEQILVIGLEATFSEKWNPFLAENAYDKEVVNQIFAGVLLRNADNELQEHAGSITADQQADGTVLYTVKLKDGITFSDGTPVTIDDYIYGLYVHADPSYTGPISLLNAPIEGVSEYYYDDPNYSAAIAGFEKTASEQYATDTITFDKFLEYAQDTGLDGWWSPDDIADFIDYINGEDPKYAEALAAIDAANPDEVFKLVAQIEYENYLEYYDTYNWYLDSQKQGYATGNLDDGIDVPEISGIKKVDDLTCTVKYTTVDIYGDVTLGDPENGMGMLKPKHYYGDFVKGDVSKILNNMVPLGSGPYIWNSFADNIATLTANPNFFLGEPKIGTVRWQYIPPADQISSLASGAIDIIEVNKGKEGLEELRSYPNIRVDLTDNNGYGYMGMNCANLSDVNVRKAIWSIMNRYPAVEGYYGEIASVIERPMTTVLAEYPDDATTPYYPYSRDEALKYFEAAGYTQKDGKLVDANGNQFKANVFIGGDGVGDHPAYAMLVQAAEDLKALGGELQIQDVQFGVLMAAVDDGTADMWTMAWGEVNSCDKTDQFYTGAGQNKYRYSNPKMDEYLDKIKITIDLNERKQLVKEMLELAMEDCIEFPLYQRKNNISYNTDTVNVDTIVEGSTFYNYKKELYKVELNG